jgi:molybdate transport system ATP-binding protein
MDFLLKTDRVGVKKASTIVLQDISFTLMPGDHLAISGASGSGKTTLAMALSGRTHYSGSIDFATGGKLVLVEQQHHFKNLSNTSDFYYQQRFNSFDAGDAHTVQEYLGEMNEQMGRIVRDMKIEYLLAKPLIQLSNGENKKAQLARALLTEPTVLILDQPFVGLDKSTREYLHTLINQLAQNVLIILITGLNEIPACVTKVLLLENGNMKSFGDTATVENNNALVYSKISPARPLPVSNSQYEFDTVVRMKNVHVQYGDKKILDDINWEVKKGEKWLLSGPNGAGKSTLLSLITADNPQAYANDIYLFDRKRGSGESIWDIKKKTGFLSPELHLYFDYSCSCFEVIASGLFDTIGLFRQLNDQQTKLIYGWMDYLDIRPFAHKRLHELSAGQQRVVLLGRALVKDPPLFILDEPCQGLDDDTENKLLSLIDAVCKADKTLIYVTHYAAKRPECIDKFINIEAGRMV